MVSRYKLRQLVQYKLAGNATIYMGHIKGVRFSDTGGEEPVVQYDVHGLNNTGNNLIADNQIEGVFELNKLEPL